MKRRHFLKHSAFASAPLILPASVLGQGGAIAPSERIGLALIGCGGQGSGVFNGILNNKEVQGLAVCDTDSDRMNKAKAKVDGRYAKDKASGTSKGCDTYSDFRELCALLLGENL